MHTGLSSSHALQTLSVAGPTCATLAWPRRGAALASSSCTVRPLFLAPLSALDFCPHPHTRPPTLFSFLVGTVTCTPPRRANPVPSFLLFPTQACTGSAPCLMLSPPRDPMVISLHAASTASALRHHRCPPGYKMPPCLPFLHSTPRSKVELVESIPSISA
jgi:hypothetical protein